MYGCRLQSTTAAVTNAADAGERCWGVPAEILGFCMVLSIILTSDKLAPNADPCH